MKRRFALYLSIAAPAVAAVTVIGTGVSRAEVSRVAPGPRVVADAASSGASSPQATHPRAAASHRTKPAVHLTCHETDKPTTGPKPAATESDSVTCHWSHVRRHLKVGSFELLRGASDPGAPAPEAIQSIGSKAHSYTDPSVADRTSYTYVLHVLNKDGSQIGTSNTVKVKDDDDRARPDCADRTAPSGPATTPSVASAANCPAVSPSTTSHETGSQRTGGTSTASPTQPTASTSSTGSVRPDSPTPATAPHPAGPSAAVQHRGADHHDAPLNGTRSPRDSTEQADHD